MRYNTLTAVEQFIFQLQYADIVHHWYHDGDMMYFSLKTGERIMCYLVERAFTLQNLEHHLTTNNAQGLYSLFIFDADMFLPADGDIYFLEDWLQALEALQGKIYGYEVAGRHSFFFPVYFDGFGQTRRIRHGDLLDVSLLHGEIVAHRHAPFEGNWRLGTFDSPNPAERAKAQQAPVEFSPLALYYAVLGVPQSAPLDTIKKAYRDLARQFHPDLNTSPHAIVRMKQINDAYTRLMHQFGE